MAAVFSDYLINASEKVFHVRKSVAQVRTLCSAQNHRAIAKFSLYIWNCQRISSVRNIG
jgi:hypothetical protein